MIANLVKLTASFLSLALLHLSIALCDRPILILADNTSLICLILNILNGSYLNSVYTGTLHDLFLFSFPSSSTEEAPI